MDAERFDGVTRALASTVGRRAALKALAAGAFAAVPQLRAAGAEAGMTCNTHCTRTEQCADGDVCRNRTCRGCADGRVMTWRGKLLMCCGPNGNNCSRATTRCRG